MKIEELDHKVKEQISELRTLKSVKERDDAINQQKN